MFSCFAKCFLVVVPLAVPAEVVTVVADAGVVVAAAAAVFPDVAPFKI